MKNLMKLPEKKALIPYCLSVCFAIGVIASLFFLQSKTSQLNDLNLQVENLDETASNLQDDVAKVEDQNSNLTKLINSLKSSSNSSDTNSSNTSYTPEVNSGTQNNDNSDPGNDIRVSGVDLSGAGTEWLTSYILTNTTSSPVYQIVCNITFRDSNGNAIKTVQWTTPGLDPGQSATTGPGNVDGIINVASVDVQVASALTHWP